MGSQLASIPTLVTSAASESSKCQTVTIKIEHQPGLEIVGVGASGQIYKIDEDVVLKAGRVFELPNSDASQWDNWFYASESVFHFNLIKDERFIFRLLEQQPHPNIAEAIDTDHTEGIYLRKYQSLSEFKTTERPGRIAWYHDILSGLLHLHSLGIAHSDVRMDNVLIDPPGRALLCDFSASGPFGQPNPPSSDPGRLVPLNGLTETLSDASDRFAMASLMFQMETGAKPLLSIDNSGTLVVPQIHTGHADIDLIITKAWLGEYSSTAQMLEHPTFLREGRRRTYDSITYPVSKDTLRDRVRQWRKARMEQYGCVLRALPAEDQLRSLAHRYGWDMDEQVRFNNYKIP
ncbi:kinase-like protein [Xylariaceae sp. AK1471]|nr:kinase-like protein [Xylariaceae sp. AK1471]